MVQQSSQPERPTTTIQPTGFDNTPEPKTKMGGGMLQYIIPIAISVIIAYLLIGYIGVSKNDFTTNITSMNNKLDGTIKTVNSIADKTNTMVLPADFTALQTSLKTVQSSITGFAPNGDVATLRTDVNGLKSSVASLQAIPKVDTNAFASKTDIQTLTDKDTATANTIKTLQTSIDATTKALIDANAKVATLTQNVTDLQTAVKALQTTTPTPTPTPTGTPNPTPTPTPTNGVALTVITPTQSLPIPPNTSTSNISLTNYTGKQVYTEVLYVTLAFAGTAPSSIVITSTSGTVSGGSYGIATNLYTFILTCNQYLTPASSTTVSFSILGNNAAAIVYQTTASISSYLVF